MADNFDRTVGVQCYRFGNASQQEPVYTAPAMGTDHDQVRAPFGSFAQDHFFGRGDGNRNRAAGFDTGPAQDALSRRNCVLRSLHVFAAQFFHGLRAEIRRTQQRRRWLNHAQNSKRGSGRPRALSYRSCGCLRALRAVGCQEDLQWLGTRAAPTDFHRTSRQARHGSGNAA